MAQRTSFLNSDATWFNKDFHHTWIHNYLLSQIWVMFSDYDTKPEFELSNWAISAGKAIVKCTRTTWVFAGSEILASFHSTSSENIDTAWDKKIYIEIPEWYVNDSATITDALTQWINLWVWRLVSSADYPSHSNYIPLWEITWWDRENAVDMRKEILWAGKPNTIIYYDDEWKEHRIDLDTASIGKYLKSTWAWSAPIFDDPITSAEVFNLKSRFELGEDVVAWDWKGSMFHGYGDLITTTWASVTKNIGNTVNDWLEIGNLISNTFVNTWVLNGFTALGSPWNITVTFDNINNTNKTISLTSANVSSSFDIAEIYHIQHWERLQCEFDNIVARITLDTPNVSNYYQTSVVTPVTPIAPVNWSEYIDWEDTWEKIDALSFVVDTWYNNNVLKNLSINLKGESSSINNARLLINWNIVWSNVITTSFVSFVIDIYRTVKAWDIIEFQAYNISATNYSLDWTSASYNFEWRPNQTLYDWFETGKLWLSDIRYKYSNKSDWIVVESWAKWDEKLLVSSWYLEQTSATPWVLYYLDNTDDTDRWEFTTVKTSTYIPYIIGIWQESWIIDLYINEENHKTKSFSIISPNYPQSYFESLIQKSIYLSWDNAEITKIKEAYISDDCSLNISFEWYYKSTFSTSCKAYIYVNWISVTEFTLGSGEDSTDYSKFSDNIELNKWDHVSIYVKNTWTESLTAYIRNFVATYIISIQKKGLVLLD